MFLTIGKIKSLINESLLIEVTVLADKAKGLDVYRAYDLRNGKTDVSIGKLVIVPTTMPTQGQNSIDELLKKMGLKQTTKDGRIADPYVYVLDSHSLIIDHKQRIIDLDTSFAESRSRRAGKTNKSYVIPHGDVSFDNVDALKKVLKALMKNDDRINASYKVVGNPTYDKMSISDVLNTESSGHKITKGGEFKPMTLYHGTSEKRWKQIKSRGLAPGNAPEVYYDLIPDYSDKNVYLTTSISVAENYATRAAVDDRSKAVVLRIIVKDPTKFVIDEDTANWMLVTDPQGEERQVHFRPGAVKYDPNDWRNWSNANHIMQQYQSKIAKSINKHSTIGYRGTITPVNISIHSTYKPASMKKDPDSEEFAAATQKTMSTYKTYENFVSVVKKIVEEEVERNMRWSAGIAPGGISMCGSKFKYASEPLPGLGDEEDKEDYDDYPSHGGEVKSKHHDDTDDV